MTSLNHGGNKIPYEVDQRVNKQIFEDLIPFLKIPIWEQCLRQEQN
jgi:hypothetical protein